MSSGKTPADTPSFRLDEMPQDTASSSLPLPAGTQSSTSSPGLRPEDALQEGSSRRRPSPLPATPSFEGLHLPGSEQPLRIPSPHRYPGTMSDEKRDMMTGVDHELPKTPTEKYHERFVTKFAKPMDDDRNQKWLEDDGPTDREKRSHEEWKQLRHVENHNQNESRQMRSANNSNRQHDQNYQQRAKHQEDNFEQRGHYYATNIDQRDWYYTNSLQLRKRGEEQRDKHQNANFAQREEQHDANYAQREEQHDANYAQRDTHQTDNYAQRERHHREAQRQRWWLGGAAATTTATVGLGTYALRQGVTSHEPSAPPTKRFIARDGSDNPSGLQGKQFIPRDGSDTAAGFNPHGAARNVRMNTMENPSGFPSTIGSMLPDDKRPVKEFGETGLTNEELAQLGQPAKPANPYGDLQIRQTPPSDPAQGSNPAPRPNPHGAARQVRTNEIGNPSGFPSTVGTMQPDDKRPVKEFGETGLTNEQVAQFGQPPKPVEPVKPVNPHGDQQRQETPRSDPVPKANPAPASHPASRPYPGPRRPIGVKAR